MISDTAILPVQLSLEVVLIQHYEELKMCVL